MAVAAAFVVGLRQTKIQELSVRSELFDRRYENYETVRDFLQATLRLAGEPSQEVINKFFTAQREARFLFGPDVYEHLDAIWNDCGEMFVAAQIVASGTAPEGYDYQEQVRRKSELFKKINSSFLELHNTYHQLRLDL